MGKYHNTEVLCIQCAKTFTPVDQLNRHMKSHMLDPYCCDVCSKTFTRLDNLKRHKAEGCLQSDESFNCDHCEKVFSSDQYLKKHMKVYHGSGLPVTCELCTKTFILIYQLLKHKKKDHQTKPLNHNRFNLGQDIFANIQSGEQRF